MFGKEGQTALLLVGPFVLQFSVLDRLFSNSKHRMYQAPLGESKDKTRVMTKLGSLGTHYYTLVRRKIFSSIRLHKIWMFQICIIADFNDN